VDNKGIGIAILIGLGLLGLWFFTRKTGVFAPAIGQPLKLMPAGSSARQYTNEERWEITYSPDGLPTQVVVHRDAKVANADSI